MGIDAAARRMAAAALVAAPGLLLLANALHPREFRRDHEAQQLAEIANTYSRWQGAHVLAYFAVLVFAFAIAGLAVVVFRGSPRLAVLGAAAGITGLIGAGASIALDGFTWGVLGEVSDRADPAAVQLALRDIQQSEWNLPYYVSGLGFVVGIVLLAVGVVRHAGVPAWAGGLLALGGAMAGIEGAVQDNAYFIVASAVLLAGGSATAWALARAP